MDSISEMSCSRNRNSLYRLSKGWLPELVIFSLLILALGGVSCRDAIAAAPVHVPAKKLKTLPMTEVGSVSTYVRSGQSSENTQGIAIAVNILYPSEPRYDNGAPVVVVVPGGHSASGLNFTAHSPQSGLIEIRFAFPGGGIKAFHSEGSWDNRGPASLEALRDVLLFAAGEKRDIKGRTIGDLLPVKPDTSNLGAIGWENGGNTLLSAMSRYALDLGCLKWIAFFETPLGALAGTGCLGTKDELTLNNHYREGSAATGRCIIDWTGLSYDPHSYRHREAREKKGMHTPKGVLFFDENNNGQWEESSEFPLSYDTEPGIAMQFYPPEVTEAIISQKLFNRKSWPRTIATPSQTDAFFKERDGERCIKQVAERYPELLVMIVATRIDGHQRQPDHPHIALNYNAWLAAKPAWVKLNPDARYLGVSSDMNPINFPNNKPSHSIDAHEIRRHLLPEGLVPDYILMQAAVSELADRTREKRLEHPLSTVIVDYVNAAVAKMKLEQARKQAEENAKKAASSAKKKLPSIDDDDDDDLVN